MRLEGRSSPLNIWRRRQLSLAKRALRCIWMEPAFLTPRSAPALTQHADTVSFCLSKGLSAPIGSLLTGSREFIARARMVRRAMGGTLRQAGIIAAPGLIGLRTLIPRLSEDHSNARLFAEGVSGMEGLAVDLESVQTNIINLDVGGLGIDAGTFASHLDPLGVRGLPGMGNVVRFVTYRGISRGDIERSLSVIQGLVDARPWLGVEATA